MKLALLIAVVAACSGGPRDPSLHGTSTPVLAPAPTAPAVVAAPPAPLGPSIYDLALPLRDADDHVIGLDAHRGHRVLVSMFYGSCAMACPAPIGDLPHVAADAGDDTQVLLVSFDAARDTPARLRELAQTHKLDARWTLASASTHDARTLAAVLGIKYRATAAGEFIHNSVIVALDTEGRPLARLDGLRDSAPLLVALGGRTD
jgi:protein SCO1/2